MVERKEEKVIDEEEDKAIKERGEIEYYYDSGNDKW